jgi:hypothetical protein
MTLSIELEYIDGLIWLTGDGEHLATFRTWEEAEAAAAHLESGGGACPACRANGVAWDTPNEAGRCYQCNGELE